jgi:acetolactate synthase regulatory subunit
VTILGRGDLAPPRRYRRRRGRRLGLALLLLVVLGAGGWFAWTHLRSDGKPATLRAHTPCPTPSASPAPLAPSAVTMRLLNGTARVGLAHRLAAVMRRRGFHVVRVGNTTSQVAGASIVYYGAGQLAAATTVAEHVPGATLMQQSRAGVELDIGSDFVHLATPTQVAAAKARDLTAASPSPAPCARP